MPLMHGYSRLAIAHNIKKEEKAGKSAKQALAIALSEADRAKKKKR